MSNAKESVVASLNELASAFGTLKSAHSKAQSAIKAYASALNDSDEPQALLSQFPALFNLGSGDIKAGSPEAEAPVKRKRGPNKNVKPKDPNAPKRPASAYIEYQNSVREEFRKQYADLAYSEVLKKIGLVWQGMSDEDKKPWNDITDAKKSEYVDKKKAYDEETAGAPAATPAAADDDEPKAYTGKKRGRKSNAEKAAIAAAEAKENGASSSRVEDIPVDEPKQKKSKTATPSKKAAAAESSEEEEDDSEVEAAEGSSEDESDGESSEEEPAKEPTPPPAKVKKDKHKVKKSKQ